MAEASDKAIIINGVSLSLDLAHDVCKAALGKSVAIAEISEAGAGVHGTAIRVRTENDGDIILKIIREETSLGHDYVSDRFTTLLNSHAAYDYVCPGISLGVVLLEKHSSPHLLRAPTEAVGVLRPFPARESLAQQAKSLEHSLSKEQRGLFVALCDAMIQVHSTIPSMSMIKHIHRRKLREVVAHSHWLLGTLDSYDAAADFGRARQLEYATKVLAARYALIDDTSSITQIHGDPHFDNVWIDGSKIYLVDPGGGQYGHPAEDVACAIVDLLLWSVVRFGSLAGGYREAISILLDEYVEKTGRREVFQYIPLYLGVKIPIVVHPVWYPRISNGTRCSLLSIGARVLKQSMINTDVIEKLAGYGQRQNPTSAAIEGNE